MGGEPVSSFFVFLISYLCPLLKKETYLCIPIAMFCLTLINGTQGELYPPFMLKRKSVS